MRVRLTVWIITFSFLSTCFLFAQYDNRSPIVFDVGYSHKTFQNVNLRDALVATQILVKKVIARTGLDICAQTRIYNDNQAIIDALKNKRLDLIALLPEEFIEIRKQATLDAYLVASVDGNIYEEYLLLVRGSEKINRLSDLQDKRILLYGGTEGDMPEIWLDVMLLKTKLPEHASFFSEIKKEDGVSQAVLPVFFGQADACIVTKNGFKTMLDLNPQVGQVLSILEISPKTANGLCCINHRLENEKLRELIKRSLRELHCDPEGKQILMLFKSDKFELFEPCCLENVEALLKEYQELKKGVRETN